MRTALSCIGLVALLVPAAATAQTGLDDVEPGPRHADVSISLGQLFSTNWGNLLVLRSESAIVGVREEVLARELVVKPTHVVDTAFTYWEGRYGFRAHVGYADSCLAIGARCGEIAPGGGRSDSVDMHVWTYDIGGAVGLTSYHPTDWVKPYVYVGVGGVTYDLQHGIVTGLTFNQPIPGTSPAIVVAPDNPNQLLIRLNELNTETKFAVTFGVGTDLRVPLGPVSLGLRLEGLDRIHSSPVQVGVADVNGFPGSLEVDFGLVHNFQASGGLVVQFGH